MKHVLDTTALVAHALAEEGAGTVQAIIADEANDILLSAVSLFELAGVLKMNGSADQIPVYWEAYRQIAEVVPVDAALAMGAWDLREEVGERIPIADAIIAATARQRGATLVHRDKHLAQIPETMIPQIRIAAP